MEIPSQIIKNRLCRLAEFPDEYSINGVLYKKDTMQTKGEFLLVNAFAPDPEIIIDRYMMLDSQEVFSRGLLYNTFFYDNNDINVLWLVHNSFPETQTEGNQNGISKFKRINGKWEEESFTYWQSSASISRYELIPVKQDAAFIYFSIPCWWSSKSTVYSSYVGRFNKNTLGWEHASHGSSHYFNDPVLFHETADKLYFIKTGNYSASGSTRVALAYINKNPDEFDSTWYHSLSFDSGVYPPEIAAKPRPGDGYVDLTQNVCPAFEKASFYFLDYYEELKDNIKVGYPNILMFTLNTSTGKLYDEFITKKIIGPENLLRDLNIVCLETTDPDYSNRMNIHHVLNTLEDNGKKYLIYTTFTRPWPESTSTSYIVNSEYYKIVVFEDIGNDTFEVKSITQLNQRATGLVQSRNNKKLLFSSRSGVTAYVWESLSESFIKGSFWAANTRQFGFDRDERIIIRDYNDEIIIDNLFTPETVTLEIIDVPEKSNFENEIQGTLKITVNNTYKVQVPFLNLKIKLTGSCTFLDGTQITTIDKITDIPIIITGPGTYKASVII